MTELRRCQDGALCEVLSWKRLASEGRAGGVADLERLWVRGRSDKTHTRWIVPQQLAKLAKDIPQYAGSDGVMQRPELAALLKEKLHSNASEALHALWRELDLDRSGQISVDEFRRATSLGPGRHPPAIPAPTPSTTSVDAHH